MLFHKFALVCALVVCLTSGVYAQSVEDTSIIPLTVDKGFPIQVRLTEKVQFKQNGSVHGTITEPVYAFDRVVIPSGTEIEGKITGFQKAGRWKRISAMLAGDFTPQRTPQITFDTLVLPHGERVAIETSVTPGPEKIVQSAGGNEADTHEKKSLVSTVKPGKERLKTMLWGMAPYHPQYLPADTPLTAVLESPLDFGVAVFREGALDDMGVEPPADSIVSVRLLTPLNSRTTQSGASVEALLTRPLFSSEHRLIFPVGTVLRGTVIEVNPARALHRNGQLALKLTTIAPPDLLTSSAPQQEDLEAKIVDLQVGHEMKDLRIDKDGSARLVESKKRLIGPAWAFIKAGRSLNHNEDSFATALFGAYRGKFLKQFIGGEPGFGLPASISSAMIPPVGIGLGFFGAARSVYSNFLGRGREIQLPTNTMMEIRLEKVIPSANTTPNE
jgi:hypothetical protein